MKQIRYTQTGGPEVLTLIDTDRPNPLPTEVLVKVVAAGVNPVDWKTRAGGGLHRLMGEGPWGLGWDVSGRVEAVGFGVTTLKPGDEVFGMPWFPKPAHACSEYVTAPSRHFALKPKSLSHAQAAGLPLAGLTAWQALVDTANIRPAQRVLIHAGAGGVGHLAVQIAVALGAHVIATASKSNLEFVRALGAHAVVDYQAQAFEDVVRDIDVVMDNVGGSYASRSIRTLRKGGLLVEIPGGDVPSEGELKALGVRSTPMLVEPDRQGLLALARLADEGKLKVHVSLEAPLSQAAEVHAKAQAGHTRGKAVLIV